MTEELKNARDKVLVDNTAQAVFKHLDRIKDNHRALGARWIWELLQNARDAAGQQGVRIRAHVSATEFRFEHDGKPFASEEIAHLIYHGSTKIEDFEDIGQFGSGFLATHLLSKIIRVAGRLEDSSGFDFPLDRAGGTAEELREAMDRSWAAFEQSVEDARPAPDATTSFAYDIAEPGARELAEAGLEELRRSGPLVLAFCPEITEIAVETSGAEWKLSRDSQEEGSVLTIRYVGEREELSRFVAVAVAPATAPAEAECCAALQLRPGESGLEVDQAQETAAKLFVLFPLIGSERLGLPATVNSRRFKPREDRDGIVAGDSPGAQENRRLLEDSVRLQERLASGAGLSWLVSLLELARDAGETGLLDGHNLLPTQSGGLCRRPDIRRDEGISEELKDIAEAFGLEIRDELLDKGAEIEGLAELLASEREPELLDRVLARVKDECREGVIRAPLALWVVRLFRWMADRPDYVERLEGYPVPTSERSDEGVAVLLLERGREAHARPLAPLATWPEGAQRFGSLFPRRRVLAETFAASDPEVWPRLAASGYVNASPLIETQRVVEAFLPDEPLPELDGADAGVGDIRRRLPRRARHRANRHGAQEGTVGASQSAAGPCFSAGP